MADWLRILVSQPWGPAFLYQYFVRYRQADYDILLDMCSKELHVGVTFSVLRKRNLLLRKTVVQDREWRILIVNTSELAYIPGDIPMQVWSDPPHGHMRKSKERYFSYFTAHSEWIFVWVPNPYVMNSRKAQLLAYQISLLCIYYHSRECMMKETTHVDSEESRGYVMQGRSLPLESSLPGAPSIFLYSPFAQSRVFLSLLCTIHH